MGLRELGALASAAFLRMNGSFIDCDSNETYQK